jgi:hypothetical protein
MQNVTKWLLGAKKALVAASSALVVTGTVFSDGAVTSEEWLALAAAWSAVFGVYQVTNLVGAVSRKK